MPAVAVLAVNQPVGVRQIAADPDDGGGAENKKENQRVQRKREEFFSEAE